MIKIFLTGDNHFGKRYDRYPEAKEKLVQSRFECFRDMVRKAEEEACDFFVVAGDLFDTISTIRVLDVKKIAEILASFSGTVLILPGNHDYYTGDEKVWDDFQNALSGLEHNIILFNEFREYTFDVRDELVSVYPALCNSKHSKENNLGWIKSAGIERDGTVRIGIAHGALSGVTPDLKEEYFLMTESELNAIPVDVWLIGHTHIPYPEALKEDEETTGYKIFNAGTHAQTDLNNHTEGCGFILSIEKHGTGAEISAKKYISGKIRFYDLEAEVRPERDDSLSEAIRKATDSLSDDSVVRLRLKGSVRPSEYQSRERIFEELLSRFLSYETEERGLSEEITIEKIRDEFAETSFAAKFMEQLLCDPTELQMAYELLQSCRED